jgi:outer membrane protein assembly factor BamD
MRRDSYQQAGRLTENRCKYTRSGRKIIILFLLLLLFPACSSKKDAIKKTSPFDPVAAFQEANEKVKKRRFEEAREILETIRRKDISGEYAKVAQIRIGDTYFKEGLYEEAAVEYEHFLRVHSYHKYAVYAQYQLAMTFFKRIGTADVSYEVAQRALKEFEKLLRLYPRNPYISVVENRIRACNNILAEYEFYVGEYYFKKGSYRAAVGRFSGLLRDYPKSNKVPESLYYLGISYQNLGERNNALETLSALIEKYPTTSLSKDAKEVIVSWQEEEK